MIRVSHWVYGLETGDLGLIRQVNSFIERGYFCYNIEDKELEITFTRRDNSWSKLKSKNKAYEFTVQSGTKDKYIVLINNNRSFKRRLLRNTTNALSDIIARQHARFISFDGEISRLVIYVMRVYYAIHMWQNTDDIRARELCDELNYNDIITGDNAHIISSMVENIIGTLVANNVCNQSVSGTIKRQDEIGQALSMLDTQISRFIAELDKDNVTYETYKSLDTSIIKLCELLGGIR